MANRRLQLTDADRREALAFVSELGASDLAYVRRTVSAMADMAILMEKMAYLYTTGRVPFLELVVLLDGALEERKAGVQVE